MTPTLSAAQIDRFASHGFLVLPALIAPAAIDRLRAEADAVLSHRLARMAATGKSDPRVTWWRLTSGKPYVLKVQPTVDLAPTAAEIADGAELRTILADLLGATPTLLDSSLVYEQTVNLSTGWASLPVRAEKIRKHTDAAYYTARGYPHALTVSVCLDPCRQTTGAARVWPGSHHGTIQVIQIDDQGPVVPDTAAPDSAAVTLVAEPGTVLIRDAALVHARGPNPSGRPRRLLVLGYGPIGSRTGGEPR